MQAVKGKYDEWFYKNMANHYGWTAIDWYGSGFVYRADGLTESVDVKWVPVSQRQVDDYRKRLRGSL